MGRGERVERIIMVGRVSKTVSGGRRPSYFAIAVVGNLSGCVGYGRGKASDVQVARMKAISAALKSVVEVDIDDFGSISHSTTAKCKSVQVKIDKRSHGTGVISSNDLRPVFECAGIKNVNVKLIGSRSTMSRLGACFTALRKLKIDSERFVECGFSC